MTEGLAFEPEDDGQVADEGLADLGERMRLARLRAGLTQEDLGGKLGVTKSSISRWESGERTADVRDLLRIAEGCGVPASSLLPPEHRESPGTDDAGGQFMTIAFMGHTELTGYVTEVTLGGEPGYHVDLPERLWGGNPLAWEEYSGKALFSRRPVTEESVRRSWEARLRAAEKRRQQEAEWDRAARQRALAAGEGFGFETGDGDYGDDDE